MAYRKMYLISCRCKYKVVSDRVYYEVLVIDCESGALWLLSPTLVSFAEAAKGMLQYYDSHI